MWFKEKKFLKESETVSFRWATGYFTCFSWDFDSVALDKHAAKDIAVEMWLNGELRLDAVVNKERFEQMKKECIDKQPKPAYVV